MFLKLFEAEMCLFSTIWLSFLSFRVLSSCFSQLLAINNHIWNVPCWIMFAGCLTAWNWTSSIASKSLGEHKPCFGEHYYLQFTTYRIVNKFEVVDTVIKLVFYDLS